MENTMINSLTSMFKTGSNILSGLEKVSGSIDFGQLPSPLKDLYDTWFDRTVDELVRQELKQGKN